MCSGETSRLEEVIVECPSPGTTRTVFRRELAVDPGEIRLRAPLLQHVLHPQAGSPGGKTQGPRGNTQLAEDPGNVGRLARHPPG